MVTYVYSAVGLTADKLHGFWLGWPNPPSPETHLRLLQQSDYVVLAVEQETGRVVGFITAITDHVLSAYIPLLEVRPEFRGQGIGEELVRRMLTELQEFYMVDLTCDPDLQPFYARLGMQPASGMMIRNYKKQSGV